MIGTAAHRTLVLTELVPDDPDRFVAGVHQRLGVMVEAAGRLGPVDLGVFVRDGAANWPAVPGAVAELGRRWGVDVTLHRLPCIGWPRRDLVGVVGALSRGSVSTAYGFVGVQVSGRRVTAAVQELLAGLDPDLVLAHRMGSLAWTRGAAWPTCPVVLDLDDVESDRARQRLARATGPVHKLWRGAEYPLVAAAERRAVRRSTMVLLCTPEDAERVARRHPGAQTSAVPNGVAVPDAASADGSRASLLFVGTYAYEPNVRAARSLALGVLPRVRLHLPEARAVLVGDHEERLGLSRDPHVEVHGFAPDLADAYADAGVVAVPLRDGSGISIKVLEAAAHGKAIVMTSVAGRGTGLKDGESALVADDAEVFSDHCRRLLQDPDLRRRLGTAARRHVTAHFDRRVIVDQLAERLRQALSC